MSIHSLTLMCGMALGILGTPCWSDDAILRVDGIEPPNWWVGMKWNQVQLMVRGENLDTIEASFEDPRLRVVGAQSIGNTSYAFLDIEIPESLPPADYRLKIVRGKESVEWKFPIKARDRSSDRHQGFSQDDVIYLIVPDRFSNGNMENDRFDSGLDDFDRDDPGKRHGGDLAGIIQHLDYLKDLGVTTLWLTPILENAGRNSYHGYAATDLYRVDPRFGTNDGYRLLVEEAHKRGLKIIYDHVSNHIGIRHPWIDGLPMDQWLNGSVEEHHRSKHYKNSVTDPHAPQESIELLRSFWFVDSMPDLNQRNAHVATYLIQNMIWWIESTGLDGIREDTYPYADQTFLANWAEAILDEYPQLNIVGEIWASESAFISQFQKESKLPRDFETHLPSVMDFPLMNAFRDYLEGKGALRDVYSVVSQDFLYTDLSNLLVMISNHDTPRGIFLSNRNVSKVKQALTMALTLRGIPQLLYGMEIGLYGGKSHVELRQDFPGGFSGHERSAFVRSGRTPHEQAMFEFTAKLLKLRQEYASLRRGQLIHFPPTWNDDIYKYLKTFEGETILVLINGHGEQRDADLSELSRWISEEQPALDLMTSKILDLSHDQGVAIAPHGVLLLKLLD
jgi:glycosidase